MNYSKIGVRYAKALLQVAIEQNLMEEVRKDMSFLDTLAVSVPEFMQILESPVIKPSEKQTIMKAAVSAQISPLSLQFLDMLITHRRENRLRDIIRNFDDQYRANKGIITASITTTVALEPKVSEQISELLKKKYNKQVELKPIIESSIIGGFILQVEDLQLDSSIQTQLRKVRRDLIDTPLENN
jgi:F-type H+-transporting ATPase subunit delta